MKVAIPCNDQDNISPLFENTGQLAIYEYNDDDFVGKQVYSVKCEGYEQMTRLMLYMEVNAVICDEICAEAIRALQGYRVLVFGGVQGNIDKAYYDLVNNRLICTSKPSCGVKGCTCNCGSAKCSCENAVDLRYRI